MGSKQKSITIGIGATARFITKKDLQPVLNYLTSKNINYKLGDNVFTPYYQFAGNDTFRAKSFIKLLMDEEINYIWIVRGGYGTSRIVDQITPVLQTTKKIIIGYSDITALLMEATNNHIPSIHATMPINFVGNKKQTIECFDALINYLVTQELQWTFKAKVYNVSLPINITTKVTGGNLTMLSHLIGTKTYENIKWEDYFLLIEDTDEYLYSIDRLLVHLKRAGILDKIKGILVGDFTNLQDNEVSFGMSIIEMLLQKASVPIITGLPVGHGRVNMPIIFNKEICIKVTPEGIATLHI